MIVSNESTLKYLVNVWSEGVFLVDGNFLSKICDFYSFCYIGPSTVITKTKKNSLKVIQGTFTIQNIENKKLCKRIFKMDSEPKIVFLPPYTHKQDNRKPQSEFYIDCGEKLYKLSEEGLDNVNGKMKVVFSLSRNINTQYCFQITNY